MGLEGHERRLSGFREAADILLAESGCTVRRYRKSTTGCAYTRAADWGIEVPEPTTPLRFAIFAHEVAHQVLHRPDRGRRPRLRWVQEWEAWQYALEQFKRFGLQADRHTLRNAVLSMRYSYAKAERRGFRP